MGILLAIQGAASQGVLWGIMALGLYITFKVLDFADLTVSLPQKYVSSFITLFTRA